ncbi:hypothetical protein [Lewinella sp. W8]|uniref:hypothetical protein n=1 Tax=Lewinella sp. W8 TaxID=2528208 RepID=UPI001067211B|nr:hypothetical protein [Lewinella sp. W8]MTB52215.1 hypothetical protein [Lewinella sp. W8]
MKFFKKLFGKNGQEPSNKPPAPDLRLEYSVMSKITLRGDEEYGQSDRYRPIAEGIYQDLTDESTAKFRMAIYYELSNDETNNQYPLEDLLDEHTVHVEDFFLEDDNNEPNRYLYGFGGNQRNLESLKTIIGKKVYNQDYFGEDGQVYVRMVVE